MLALAHRRVVVVAGVAIGAAPHGPVEAARPGPHAADEEAELLAEGRPFAWRLSLDEAREAVGAFQKLSFREYGEGPRGERGRIVARPEMAGDVVLARKDVGVAYHLAVVLDDAKQKITHVIRGNDLFEATHPQRLLQALLGLPTPAYRHHPLLTDAEGRRFAKRDKAQTLRELRASGVTAQALRAELGFPG
jgi:glutamyl-Q tRNA(Asp) synthetase